MTSVVFVHGTGVRQESYDRTFGRVAESLAEVRGDVRTVPCFWGEAHGARLGLDGASFPEPQLHRGVTAEGAADVVDPQAVDEDPLALWELLDAEPLAELRAFAEEVTGGAEPEGFVPGQRDPWEEMAAWVRTALPYGPAPYAAAPPDTAPDGGASRDGALYEAAPTLAAELAPRIGEAVDRVADEIPHALGGAPYVPGIEPVVARAVFALALRLTEAAARAEEPLPVDGAERDALVAEFINRLGGGDRAAPAALRWAGARLATPVLWPLSSLARRRRSRLTGAVVPAGGDILRYQARGAELRAAIAESVHEAAAERPGPVVLLAHSLGGIACVDLLAGAEPSSGLERVELLVTVGSQAPFLYELDALTGLRRGETLPPRFPRWVNVYDERDLLGFVGEKVFPGRVRDVRVDTRQPFPRAHSAYFAHGGLYELLAEVIP